MVASRSRIVKSLRSVGAWPWNLPILVVKTLLVRLEGHCPSRVNLHDDTVAVGECLDEWFDYLGADFVLAWAGRHQLAWLTDGESLGCREERRVSFVLPGGIIIYEIGSWPDEIRFAVEKLALALWEVRHDCE